MNLAQILDAIIMMSGLVAYWFYIPFFFSNIRPKLAKKYGRALDTEISESLSAYDPGTWEAKEGASLWTQIAVLGLDGLILILGLVIPFGLIALLCAGIVESRIVADWANSISGEKVTIEELNVPSVRIGQPTKYSVRVHNLSKSAQKDCYLAMFDNPNRLYANSPMFNLELNQSLTLNFSGSEALKAGKYSVVMKLFCPPAIERDRNTHQITILGGK